jgi:hypothetical protein
VAEVKQNTPRYQIPVTLNLHFNDLKDTEDLTTRLTTDLECAGWDPTDIEVGTAVLVSLKAGDVCDPRDPRLNSLPDYSIIVTTPRDLVGAVTPDVFQKTTRNTTAPTWYRMGFDSPCDAFRHWNYHAVTVVYHAASHSDSKDLLNAAAAEIESYRSRRSAPNPNGLPSCGDRWGSWGTIRCTRPSGHEGAHADESGRAATIRWTNTPAPERELYHWVEEICDFFPVPAAVEDGSTVTVGPVTVQMLHDALADARKKGRWM